MTDFLKVLVGVLEEAQPVLDALARLRVDVGSVSGSKFLSTPPDMRLLCVAVADEAGVWQLAKDLNRELAGDPDALQLTNEVIVADLPLDARLVVFVGVVVLATTPLH